MSCFPCFQRQKSKDHNHADGNGKKPKPGGDPNSSSDDYFDHSTINAQNFTFRELAAATKNFRQECLLGEGGFGRVYRGTLKSGKIVAVKQLDRNGMQGNKEFLTEVAMLSHLKHDNLVSLIGYCADGDQRLLVFEYMSSGSLEDNLINTGKEHKHLDWSTRVKIAYGAAQGLEYLHEKADPPIIYRELKSTNILLDGDFNSKLSDFGLAKFGSGGDSKCNVPSRMMGTYGYSAPECTRDGEVTVKSDVYSFGVVFLELITGRRAMDTAKPIDEQNLVSWAQPKFRDPKSFPNMADPLLVGKFPEKALNQAVAVAAMCLQEESSVRPLMSDVVATLSFLLMIPGDPPPAPAPDPTPAPAEQAGGNDRSNSDNEKGNSNRSDSESSHSDSSESENEGDLEGKSLLESSKGDVLVATSSKLKKRRSKRRLSHKESVATSSDQANTQTNSLSEDGSFSSSYTSSASSGFSISKGDPNYDNSLSRAQSKASYRSKSRKGSRVSSRRNRTKESDSSGSSSSGEEEENEE